MTDDLRRRIAREMAWMRTTRSRLISRLWFPWLLCVVLPVLVLLPAGALLGVLPAWTALPGLLLGAACVAQRHLPPAAARSLQILVLCLVMPGALLVHLSGGKAGSADPIAAAFGGSLADGALIPLGDALPWAGAAILDLQTGEFHAESAHARLAALASGGPDAARRRVGHLPGRWLATDGQGVVALFSEHGEPLAHRRLPPPKDAP